MAKRNGKAQQRLREDESFVTFLRERGADLQDKFLSGQNRSVVTAAAREQLFLQQLDKVFERFEGKYQPGKLYIPKKHARPEMAINVNLSDLHYGAALDKREVPHGYGHVEEARRTAAVALWVAEHVKDVKKRRQTKLVLNLLGDIIQNQLHDPRDGDPLTEQFAASVHLLTQLIVYLAGQQFQEILVNCTPGNHGRNTARHHDRATNQKWDAIETMIYYALSKSTAHLPNVKFNIPYRPFFTYKLFGHNIFGTHGDTVIKPGYPNRAIEVESVRKQINEINAPLEKADKFSAFIVGHVHVSSKTKLPNSTYFMSNGCLIPTDAYAQSIGITDTACCQTMFETTPDHVVGFHCDIDVDSSTDKDASLDKIIQPFEALSP
jgi:hypothetical protein